MAENSDTEAECNLLMEDEKQNGITLEECFKSIVEGNSVEFDVENLNTILKRDLRVNFVYLKPRLKSVIPYMLVHYIKFWPGWHKNNKQISYKSWFSKFKEYLLFKVNYLIKNDYEKVATKMKIVNTNMPIIDDSILFKIDNNTQTDVPSEKYVANYTITIQGPPKILNSIIFCEGPSNDSILVRQYKTKPFCKNLTIKQLVNFPNVEVEFSSKELNFTRRNMHEFKRYIMLSNEKITFKKTDVFIEEVEIINDQLTRTAYTLNALKKYCDTYVEVLRKHQILMGIYDENIVDIKTILDEFITDIADLNMNSMATNTSVLFNIGKYIYARNKGVRTSDHAVSFAESITPKVNISLSSFTGIKDPNSDIPFQGLQALSDSNDKQFMRDFLPTIKYNCTFCGKRYKRKYHLLIHFEEKHTMEQPVLCFMCKVQMDVTAICENRWNHECEKSVGNVR